MAKKSKLASKASDVVRWRPKPSMSIYSKDYPVKDLNVGQTYDFLVTAKVTELNAGESEFSDDYGDDSTGAHARLRITKISKK
jgi:hypothetical protein